MTRKTVYYRRNQCVGCRKGLEQGEELYCPKCKHDIQAFARGTVDGWLILEKVAADEGRAMPKPRRIAPVDAVAVSKAASERCNTLQA